MVSPKTYFQLKELIVILSTVAPVDHSGKIPNFRRVITIDDVAGLKLHSPIVPLALGIVAVDVG